MISAVARTLSNTELFLAKLGTKNLKVFERVMTSLTFQQYQKTKQVFLFLNFIIQLRAESSFNNTIGEILHITVYGNLFGL